MDLNYKKQLIAKVLLLNNKLNLQSLIDVAFEEALLSCKHRKNIKDKVFKIIKYMLSYFSKRIIRNNFVQFSSKKQSKAFIIKTFLRRNKTSIIFSIDNKLYKININKSK